MGIEWELCSGADSIWELSLHKTCFSKTHGKIIILSYSMEYNSLRLVLKGAKNSFTTMFQAVYAATNGLHYSLPGMYRGVEK